MDLAVVSQSRAVWNGKEMRSAVGRAGFKSAAERVDGDLSTPIGRWPMREVFFREDKGPAPQTRLPVRVIHKNSGWGDDKKDVLNYNRFVELPYSYSAESLWRDDDLYDIMVVLGYNDDPIIPGKGSAIFLHIARPDFSPSLGCVHLSREDLLAVLREADRNSAVLISPQS